MSADWDIEAPDREGRQRRVEGAQAIIDRIRELNSEIERHLSGDEVVFDGHPTILLLAEVVALVSRYQPRLIRLLLETRQSAEQSSNALIVARTRVGDLEARVATLEIQIAELQNAVDALQNPPLP